MKESKNWLKEIARDLIALGSIPFFILVLIRVYILYKPYYLFQFVLAGIIFLILFFLFKINLYSGLSLIALIFTSLYYQDKTFAIFASLVYLLLLASLFYLKQDKKKIFLGILTGLISSLISYFVIKLIFRV